MGYKPRTEEIAKSYVRLRNWVAIICFIASGFLILTYFQIFNKEVEKTNFPEIRSHLLALLLSFSFGILIWDKFNEIIYKNEHEKLSELLDEKWNNFNGTIFQKEHEVLSGLFDEKLKLLKSTGAEDAFSIATTYLEKAKEISVIGIVQETDVSFIQRYLETTITRLENAPEKIKYRRISNFTKGKFNDHLKRCLSFGAHTAKGHDVKIMLINNFNPAYTSLIIDKEFMMLSLNKLMADAPNDIFLISTNQDVVRKFSEHFLENWTFERDKNNIQPIDSVEFFTSILERELSLKPSLDNIQRSIYFSEANVNKHLYEYALDELRDSTKVFKELEEGAITLKHTTANTSLINLFIKHIEKMKEGETYYSISSDIFWRNVSPQYNSNNSFIQANFKALEQKASVRRILVVKKEKLTKKLIGFKDDVVINYDSFMHDYDEKIREIDYWTNIYQIIRLNLNLMIDKPAYDFRIIFVDGKDEYRRYVNTGFGLIEFQNSNKILFKPKFNLYSVLIDESIVCYSQNRRDPQEVIKERSFSDSLSSFNNLANIHSMQKVFQSHIDFVRSISVKEPDFLKSDNNLKRIFGEHYTVENG